MVILIRQNTMLPPAKNARSFSSLSAEMKKSSSLPWWMLIKIYSDDIQTAWGSFKQWQSICCSRTVFVWVPEWWWKLWKNGRKMIVPKNQTGDSCITCNSFAWGVVEAFVVIAVKARVPQSIWIKQVLLIVKLYEIVFQNCTYCSNTRFSNDNCNI